MVRFDPADSHLVTHHDRHATHGFHLRRATWNDVVDVGAGKGRRAFDGRILMPPAMRHGHDAASNLVAESRAEADRRLIATYLDFVSVRDRECTRIVGVNESMVPLRLADVRIVVHPTVVRAPIALTDQHESSRTRPQPLFLGIESRKVRNHVRQGELNFPVFGRHTFAEERARLVGGQHEARWFSLELLERDLSAPTHEQREKVIGR